jgi:coenzyme F420 hydrogenase subunit beta
LTPQSLDLSAIVSHGLCAGCGLCESIAGRERVEMAITSASYMRPRQRATLDDPTLQKIRAVCPGIVVTGPDPAQLEGQGVMHDLWGPIRSLHRGWSTDEEIRFRSAAGGAMTALGCYLLESGKADAILHVRASSAHPMETDALVSRTVAEVRAGAQSRYGPAAPLRHVMRLLEEGIRFAVFAKPCDIAAIRNLARIDRRVEAQIPYLVTIFCGGVPTLQTAMKIAGYHGLGADEVSLFRWRGHGWPGPTRVETHDGRLFDLGYDKVWYSHDVPWTYDIQFRCKICPDAIGELADIACPDSWVMVDGKPIHDEAPGANLFVARTRRGHELVLEAAAAGAIHLEPFSIEELDAQHADHVDRKIENPARVRALGLEGEPQPRFARFREERMVEMAGPERDATAEAGARRRIREGKNREPIA